MLARLADENNNRVAYWSIIRALIEDNAEGIERVDELARRVHDGCEEVRALIEDAEGLTEGLGGGVRISRGGVRCTRSSSRWVLTTPRCWTRRRLRR